MQTIEHKRYWLAVFVSLAQEAMALWKISLPEALLKAAWSSLWTPVLWVCADLLLFISP